MIEREHWDDETVSRTRRALANGIAGPWLDDDSIRAVLDAAGAVPAERLEGAVRAIGDAIQLLEGYADGDAVDARALLRAGYAKFGGQSEEAER